MNRADIMPPAPARSLQRTIAFARDLKAQGVVGPQTATPHFKAAGPRIQAEHIAQHEAALMQLLAWAELSADDLAALAVFMGPFDTWPPTGRPAVLVYGMLRRHRIEGMTAAQLRAFIHRMAKATAKRPKARLPLHPARKPLDTCLPRRVGTTDPLPE